MQHSGTSQGRMFRTLGNRCVSEGRSGVEKEFVFGVIILGVVTIELLLHADENEPLEGLEEGGAEASLLLGGV